MTYYTAAPWPAIGRQMLERFVAAALIALLLSQTLLEIFPAGIFQHTTPAAPVAADLVDSRLGLHPAAPALPPLWMPQELAGKPEVVTLRTAHSATYLVGNNTYAAVQELAPIHYQDQNGAWQRIDPAFVETPLGWLNGTNSVRTLVGKRTSKATLAAGDVTVHWQPDGLVLVENGWQGERDRALLAEPLPLASAQPLTVIDRATTARYPASWSLDGLQDQWQARAGRSEYTMRLPRLPSVSWWQSAPAALDLRVRLQLEPGTTLQVDGKAVDLPLTTTRPIAFIGAHGEAMVLQPPHTFEQGNPGASVAAAYILNATTDANTLELRVRTPWAWLAAPERTFPVIIDPLFQMRNGTFGASASYFVDSDAYNNLFDFGTVGVGRFSTTLIERGILRFDLPIMPAGTSIQKAYLYAVPQDTNPGPKDPAIAFHRDTLKMRVSAHALDADWEMNPNGPTFNANPLPPGLQTMEFSRGTTVQKGVTWNAPAAADVAAYLLRWGPRRQDNPQAFLFENQALVLAGSELAYRIGAVTNDVVYGVDIAALDVNGNSSAATAPLFLTPSAASNPIPAMPTALALTGRTSTSASFQWQAGVGPAAAGYELRYARMGDVVEMGSMSFSAVNGTLNDLTTGAVYDVRVRAFNSAGWASADYTETVRVLITNGVDGNGDGMADDWASVYGITDPNGDADGDGINNVTEYQQGTNPTQQDSDGDGFSDKEEADAGTDALNGLVYGASISQPRLTLERNRLRFYGKDQDGGLPAVQQVAWANTGGGNLALQATTSASWIQASIVGDKVQVGVKSDTLEPGFYSGIVRLVPGQGSDPIIGDPACIRVNAWVAYGDNDVPSAKQEQTINFPPLADRKITTPPFAVSATASSGLPVTIVSSTPAACTIANNMVTLLAEATCTLIASQAGNDTFRAAPDVIRSFTILPEGFVYKTYLSAVMKMSQTE